MTDSSGLSSSNSATSTITQSNDSPVITLYATAVVEGAVSAGTTVATYSTSDPESTTVTVSFNTVSPYYVLVAGSGSGSVQLTAAGAAAINAGQTLDLIDLAASDGSLVTTASLQPSVLYVDDAPTISVVANDFVEDSGGLTPGVTLAGSYTTSDEESSSLYVSFNTSSAHYTLDQNGNVFLTQAGINQINAGEPLDAIDLRVSQTNDGGLFDVASDTPGVAAQNDAPTSTNDSIVTAEDTEIVLSLNDFGSYSDEDGDAWDSIKITGLESNGELQYFNGTTWVDATLNQVVTVTDIAFGYLKFVPDADEFGSPYASIGYAVGDGTTYSNSYQLSISVTAQNDAPSITSPVTLTGISEDSAAVLITEGDLLDEVNVVDVDGDALSVSSVLLVDSSSGSISSNNDGSWYFTPADDFSGSVAIMFSVTDGTSTVWGSASMNVTNLSEAEISSLTNSAAGDGEFEMLVDLTGAEVGDVLQVFVDGSPLAIKTHTVNSTNVTDGAVALTVAAPAETDADINLGVTNSSGDIIQDPNDETTTFTWS